MANDLIELEDVLSSLNQNIKALEKLEKNNPKQVELIDTNLTALFTEINTKSVPAQDLEIEQLNALFGMLNKVGRTKAKKLKLIYKPPKVVLKRKAKHVVIRVTASLTATKTQSSAGEGQRSQSSSQEAAAKSLGPILRVAPQEAVKSVQAPFQLVNQPVDVRTMMVARDSPGLNVTYNRHKNPDGTPGGFVRDGLNVSDKAYLGPNVVIFGHATIRDEPRLEGRIFVHNATVSGNAIIKGEVYLEHNTEVSGNSKIVVAEGSKLNLFDNVKVVGNASLNINGGIQMILKGDHVISSGNRDLQNIYAAGDCKEKFI